MPDAWEAAAEEDDEFQDFDDDYTEVVSDSKLPRVSVASSSSGLASAPEQEEPATVEEDQPATKRKKHSLKAPEKAVASGMLCVFGKPLKTPVVVWPLHVETDGSLWIPLTEHVHWLRRACESSGQTQYELPFQSAISELRRIFTAEVQKSRVGGPAAVQMKMRENMGISDGQGATSPNKLRLRVGQPPTTTVVLVGYTFRIRNTVRPILIDRTENAANALMEFCVQHIRGGNVILRKNQIVAKPAACQTVPPECEAVPGKVTWHPSKNAWAVHYKAATGEASVAYAKADRPTNSKSLADFMGTPPPMTKEAHQAAIAAAHKKAVDMWNAMDASKRERIGVSE